MEREAFVAFVERTLIESIVVAENVAGVRLPREFCFQWLGKDKTRVCVNVAEFITQRVYVDAEHIFPCVDLGVGDVLDEGTVLIVANVAGYAACEFKKNWTGRDGPFVYIVGSNFRQRVAGETPQRSVWDGSFGFSLVEMNGGVREWRALETGEVSRGGASATADPLRG